MRLFKRLKNMSQQNKTRHLANCNVTAEKAVVLAASSTPKVPVQKSKEDAKQVLYLNRV